MNAGHGRAGRRVEGRFEDGAGRLLVAGQDVAAVEVAASGPARRRGLLGRDGLDGAILLSPAASVHTLGMRFAIDVAFLDRRLQVLSVVTMPPGRLGLPRLRARHVLETAAGRCAEWGVSPGVRLGVRLVDTAEPDDAEPDDAGPSGPSGW